MNIDIPMHEQKRRIKLAADSKTMILNALPIEDENDNGILMAYG